MSVKADQAADFTPGPNLCENYIVARTRGTLIDINWNLNPGVIWRLDHHRILKRILPAFIGRMFDQHSRKILMPRAEKVEQVCPVMKCSDEDTRRPNLESAPVAICIRDSSRHPNRLSPAPRRSRVQLQRLARALVNHFLPGGSFHLTRAVGNLPRHPFVQHLL